MGELRDGKIRIYEQSRGRSVLYDGGLLFFFFFFPQGGGGRPVLASVSECGNMLAAAEIY